MGKITKGKIIEETNRIAGQANAFEFKPWHIVVGVIVVIAGGFFALKGLGVL